MLWRVLKFYELDQVMRQEDRVFSSILIKIGDELWLNSDEQTFIESIMFSKEEIKVLRLHGLRLFHEVRNVENYNNDVLNSWDDEGVLVANDEIIGCRNANDTNRYAIFQLKKTYRHRWFTISINVCLQPTIYNYHECWCFWWVGKWCFWEVGAFTAWRQWWTFSCWDCVPASSSWREIEKKSCRLFQSW